MRFESLTFGARLTAALAGVALMTVLSSAGAVYWLRDAVVAKDRVITVVATRRLQVEELRVLREQRAKLVRSYLIDPEQSFLDEERTHGEKLKSTLAELRKNPESSEEASALEAVDTANAHMQATWDRVLQMRQHGASLEQLIAEFKSGQHDVSTLNAAMDALAKVDDDILRTRTAAASESATHGTNTLVWLALLSGAFAAITAVLLSRTLSQQVGGALRGVQRSSAELETAAHQQVSTTQELATTTTEIATTIRELLATSRQIAESSQRVVHIAEETGKTAVAGDLAVQRSQKALATMRSQVDHIVSRMVDLGKKSQQIGGILDVINELAEQTNILSINATIEAAGAGEAGRRFGTVANEIRRLADRVGASAREIRELVDEVRSAANGTLMATEDGSKAVDAGARQFDDVLSTFQTISQGVSVTVDAAREIELSTKQQSSAVEQVNQAIGGVRQAATETQASSKQTLATCSQLATVATDLTRLVRGGATDPTHA